MGVNNCKHLRIVWMQQKLLFTCSLLCSSSSLSYSLLTPSACFWNASRSVFALRNSAQKQQHGNKFLVEVYMSCNVTHDHLHKNGMDWKSNANYILNKRPWSHDSRSPGLTGAKIGKCHAFSRCYPLSICTGKILGVHRVSFGPIQQWNSAFTLYINACVTTCHLFRFPILIKRNIHLLGVKAYNILVW